MTKFSATGDHPLSGFRVLDFTRVVSGPLCSMHLGDLGAEVLKVEHPVNGDDTRAWGPPNVGGESFYYLALNRNKKSIVLDLGKAEGREIAAALAGKSDIILENFRPGVMARLGLDYDTLSRTNQGLIYCSISAYGQQGPMADRPGYDPIIQAEFGMMSITGEVDGDPVRSYVPVVDTIASLYATIGILSAAVVRAGTGRGQCVDVSLMGAGTAALGNLSQYYLTSGQSPPRVGNAHPTGVPSDLYKTRNGPVYVSPSNDRLFSVFCRDVLRRPELLVDERFATPAARIRNAVLLRAKVQDILRDLDRDEFLASARKYGVPAGAVRQIAEALESPEIAAAGMIVTVDHPTAGRLRMVGSPLNFSATTTAAPLAPPRHGEHTDAVLSEILDYDSARLAALRESGVIP